MPTPHCWYLWQLWTIIIYGGSVFSCACLSSPQAKQGFYFHPFLWNQHSNSFYVCCPSNSYKTPFQQMALKKSFTVHLKVLLDCCDDIKSWLAIHFWNVNNQRTDCIFKSPDPRFVLKCNLVPLKKFRPPFVKTLGVIFDDSSSFEK